jgi:hypothetical protein
MLDWLTKDELDALAVKRSYDWCGTNWEDKERFRIEQILEARTQPSTKKLHPFKGLLRLRSAVRPLTLGMPRKS